MYDLIDEVIDVGAWISMHMHTHSVSPSLTHTHKYTQALKTADGHKRYVEYRNKRAE